MPSEVRKLQALIPRIGESHFRQRLHLQAEHVARMFERGRTLQRLEHTGPLLRAVALALKLAGLEERGRRNFHNLRRVWNPVWLDSLPPAFDGFRILQISDTHIDILPGFAGLLARRVSGIAYDLCVWTGDYRNSDSGFDTRAIEGMRLLAGALRPPVYAVLGNHDFLEMVPPLEEAGVRFLLNETVALERGGDRVYLSGVDDPYFYETDNLQKARDAVPAGATAILLSHSPQLYRRASACGYDLMLSGHTHGGQVCLPGGLAPLIHTDCPRFMIRGAWRFGSLQGYTSTGAGGCGLPVRFNCPPELTIHVLRARQNGATLRLPPGA